MSLYSVITVNSKHLKDTLSLEIDHEIYELELKGLIPCADVLSPKKIETGLLLRGME